MGLVNIDNLGFGGKGIPDSLPKALAELRGLRVQMVAGAGASTLVAVETMDPEDTIIAAINITDGVDIDLDTLTIAQRHAFGTLTCLTTAADGDTVVVRGKTYTFRNVDVTPSYNAPPGVIPFSLSGSPEVSDPEEIAERLAQAIMSNDALLWCEVVEDSSSPPLLAKVVVYARTAGVAGNAYTLVETGATVTRSGATFSGGADTTGQGFSSSGSLSGKNILLVWFDKRPGEATLPL